MDIWLNLPTSIDGHSMKLEGSCKVTNPDCKNPINQQHSKSLLHRRGLTHTCSSHKLNRVLRLCCILESQTNSQWKLFDWSLRNSFWSFIYRPHKNCHNMPPLSAFNRCLWKQKGKYIYYECLACSSNWGLAAVGVFKGDDSGQLLLSCACRKHKNRE